MEANILLVNVLVAAIRSLLITSGKKARVLATHCMPLNEFALVCESELYIMTPSYGNIFRFTDPLWGESTGHRSPYITM